MVHTEKVGLSTPSVQVGLLYPLSPPLFFPLSSSFSLLFSFSFLHPSSFLPLLSSSISLATISQIELNPLEVAILGMQDKIRSLKQTLQQQPPDGKLLQMQLQGGIATAVNQVSSSNPSH